LLYFTDHGGMAFAHFAGVRRVPVEVHASDVLFQPGAFLSQFVQGCLDGSDFLAPGGGVLRILATAAVTVAPGRLVFG
jgi:hypothetical protein